MGSPSYLSPLLLNEKTKEPYLRLPSPHANIILTPPRLNDNDSKEIVQILNDRRVFQWLEGTPYPYSFEDAKQWLNSTSKEAETILQQLAETQGGFVGGCPVRILREVIENGEEIFLGDCRIGKWTFDDIVDPEEKERLNKENDQRDPGDPETVWCFGGEAEWNRVSRKVDTLADYLAPSHHGRGIMTLAIGTLIEQWVKPRMGATKICASVRKGNQGSVRVFEKNGFLLEKTLENHKAVQQSKGGGMASVHFLRCQH